MLDRNPETARAWRLILAAAGVDMSEEPDDEVIDRVESMLSAGRDIVRALTAATQQACAALVSVLADLAEGVVDAEVVEPTHDVFELVPRISEGRDGREDDAVSVCVPVNRHGFDVEHPISYDDIARLVGFNYTAFPPIASVDLNA